MAESLIWVPSIVTAATSEPLEPIDVRTHLGLADDSQDAYITDLLAVAREYCESVLSQQFITATWKQSGRRFPLADDHPDRAIEVIINPIASVTSIVYVDSNGTNQTLSASNYTLVRDRNPGWIMPAYGTTWPVTRSQQAAVTVTYSAGYGSTNTSCPKAALQAIRMLTSHWYLNREPIVTGTIVANVPLAVQSLLDSIRGGQLP